MKLTFFFLFFILMISSVFALCDYAIKTIDSATDTIQDIAIGDFNNDGYNDVVVADLDEPANTGQIIVYTNNGGIGFSEEVIYNTNIPNSVFVIDMDGDGYLDILSTNGGDDEVVYHRNNITSWNNTVINDSLTDPTSIVSADFDSDGDYDIAVSVALGGVYFYRNDGSEKFHYYDAISTTGAHRIYLSYINNDDFIDLVVGDFTNDDIYIMLNGGDGDFISSLLTSYSGDNFAVGDYDNDGDDDIVLGKNSRILRNTGIGTFTNITLDVPRMYTEELALSVDDLDGDGYKEIIWQDEIQDTIQLARWNNLAFSYINLSESIDDSHVLRVGDMNDDGKPDIVYDNSETSLEYIDSDACTDIPTTETACTFPEIFCDDFNYLTPLAQKDNYVWNVVDRALNVDYYFAPQNYEMRLKGDGYLSPAHYNPLFRKEYYISYGETVTETDISPVFSTEFDYRPIKGNMTFAIDGKLQRTAVWLEARNTSSAWQSLYYLNGSDKVGTSEGVLNLICSDCIGYSSNTEVKVTAFFHDYRGVHYNDSFGESYYNVYITVANGTKYSLEDIPFYSNRTLNQKFQFFIKEETDAFYIDNYYVYVGTDRNVDTTPQYFEQFYTPISYNASSVTGGTGDMADAIESMWCVLGICSLASRVLTALVLMFTLAMAIIGFMIQSKLTPNAMAVIIPEAIFMIILTFIKLLPLWITTTVVLLGAGLGALAIVFASKT